MIPVVDRTITINGVELAWGEWGSGDGPPLLLVHGYSGSSVDFALQLDELIRHRRVVAVDHRGHGRSQKLRDVAGYSLRQLGDDLAVFAATVIGEPADVLGHSMGGYVAQWLALDHPELVRSLILMDTSGWRFGRRELLDAATALLRAFDPATDEVPTVPPGPESVLVEAATTKEWRAAKAADAAGFDRFALKALGLDLIVGPLTSTRDRLGELRLPVTVMCGTNDVPLNEQAADLAAAIPGAHLKLIEGAYHSPQLTHPCEWRTIVEAHLAR